MKELKPNQEKSDLYVPACHPIFSNDLVIILNTDLSIIEWNCSVQNTFGYSSDEVLGNPISILIPGISVKALIDQLKNEAKNQITEFQGQTIINKSLQPVLIDLKTTVIRQSPNVMNLLLVGNISEPDTRFKTMTDSYNELIRMTFDGATDFAIITFDHLARISTWSKGAEAIFGYSQQEALGKDTSLIFTPEDIAKGIDKKELLIAKDKGRAEDERWHIGKYGNRFFMSGVMTAVVNKKNETIGYAKVARDITKRKIIEEQKDEFIKIASHELKTPITTIKAFMQILLDRFNDDQDRQSSYMLDMVLIQVNRLLQLINTLLDTTTLKDGELPLLPEKTNVNDLIQEEIDQLNVITAQQRLVFQKGTVPPVSLDRRLIRQVIVNLLINALKYSQDNTDVIITTTADVNDIIISIKDQGLGVPARDAEKIFERYFRASNVDQNKDNSSGLGLGLYITKKIIERHNGTITLESQEGHGSVFTFKLPFNNKLHRQ